MGRGEWSQALDLLCALTARLHPGPSELAEVYSRSGGSSGALVYVSNRTVADLRGAATAVGATAHQLVVMSSLVTGIRTTRYALKAGTDGTLSMFAAIDFPIYDIPRICSGVGRPHDGPMLASALHSGGWQPCGLALECPYTGDQPHRLRIYAMSNGGLLDRIEALNRRLHSQIPVNDPFLRLAALNDPSVVNCSVQSGEIALKIEVPHVPVLAAGEWLWAPAEQRWWQLVEKQQTRLAGNQLLSHLGVRWSSKVRELCAYIRPEPRWLAQQEMSATGVSR